MLRAAHFRISSLYLSFVSQAHVPYPLLTLTRDIFCRHLPNVGVRLDAISQTVSGSRRLSRLPPTGEWDTRRAHLPSIAYSHMSGWHPRPLCAEDVPGILASPLSLRV